MTNLVDQINGDIKRAMLAHDKVRLETVRSIKKEFIEAKTAKGSDGDLSDEVALKILQKMAKQRHESAEIYSANGRMELAEAELAEAAIIAEYLPKQLSKEEITPIISDLIVKLGVTDPKQMGRLIGAAQKELSGQADGRLIADVVRELLNS